MKINHLATLAQTRSLRVSRKKSSDRACVEIDETNHRRFFFAGLGTMCAGQGCQMVYFQTKKLPILVYFGRTWVENFAIFIGHLVLYYHFNIF
jgi:hypothetical protein